MQQAHLIPGFILHRRSYSETSLILEVFTREYGRLGLMARGARRRSGRNPTPMEPFQVLLLSWRGRGELPTLGGCEPNGPPIRLTGNQLVSGLYLNELIVRLLQRGDAHPELFDNYAHTLARLAGPADTESLLRSFEVRLMEAVGYALELQEEVGTGQPVSAQRRYRYDPEAGPRPADGSDTIGGDTLIALARDEGLSQEQRREAKRLMRGLLNGLLDGRPLNSRKLWRR